jgi:hypothetical protein
MQAMQEAETTLHLARRRRGTFPLLPLSFFHGKWGLHLVVLYLVCGDLRVPWVYRLWRGKGEKSLALLALRLLAALPPWMRKAFGIRVVADAAFGTLCFLTGVQGMGLEAVVGMRRDRRTREGQRLLNLRRQGSKVYLRGLAFPVWVSWYRYPLPKGKWEWRYVVATFPASGRQAEVPHRAFLQGHEKRVFFGAIRPENPLRGASFPGALLSRLPAGALGADGAGGRGADLAGGGQGVPAPSLARTCSSGGTGGTSCPRPLAPTAG